jgi:hypothetical protein
MKRIIDGKRYNTETATWIGEASWGGSWSDFSHWEADLYKTPRGNFFLAGKGGPMTMWAQPIGNNGRTGGSGIIPLDAGDAREWAERHLGTRAVEEHFGDMVEDA